MEQNSREKVGVHVAAFIVIAFVAIGFAYVAVYVLAGTKIEFPPDWNAAMLSLASAALGYLIGKQSTSPSSPVTVTTDPDEAPLKVQAVPPSPPPVRDGNALPRAKQ
jgi:hypothetical protein